MAGGCLIGGSFIWLWLQQIVNVGSPVLESVPVLSKVHINAPHFVHATIGLSSALGVEHLSVLKCVSVC